MNAHAPIDDDRPATGRARLDTQVFAVQQAAVLRYLAEPAAVTEMAAMAAALDRDPSNLRKTLEKLVREGLVTLKPYALTDEGRSWIPRLAALEGAPLAGGLPPLSWLRIFRDPNNPRKDFESPQALADLAALAENIARRGLRQALLVRLDTEANFATLVDGERRHRAIEILIRNEDPRWPAARPIPYTVTEATEDADHLADALITSIHKKNLHPLEEAAVFASLKAMGWSPGRILDETGVERKTYENRLDLLHLTDAQKARMRLDKDDDNYLSTKGARILLQHLRQIAQPAAGQQIDIEALTLDLPIKLQLALLEVAHAVEQRPDRGRVALTGRPEGGAFATIVERGLVTIEQAGGKWSVGIPKAGAAMAWLNDFHFFDNPASRLAAVRVEVLGPTRHALLESTKVYATDELNTDPAVYRGVRFPNAMRANEARRVAEGEGGGAGSPGRPKAAAAGIPGSEAPELKPRHLLILTELAHKVLNDPVKPAPFGYGVTRVGAHWLDGNVEALVQQHHLIAFKNLATDDGWLGYLTDAGWEVLFERTRGSGAVTADVLKAAQEAVVGHWDDAAYVTRWLNVEAKAAEPIDTAGELSAVQDGAAEPDDEAAETAKAADVLARVQRRLAELKNREFFKEGVDYVTDLIAETGVTGPFAAASYNPGIVVDSQGEAVLVVDVDGEMLDDLVHARALLIAAAMNIYLTKLEAKMAAKAT